MLFIGLHNLYNLKLNKEIKMEFKNNEAVKFILKTGSMNVTLGDSRSYMAKNNSYATEAEIQHTIDYPEVYAMKVGFAITKHKQEMVVRREIQFEQYFMYEGMLCKAFHQKRGSDVSKGVHIDIVNKNK